MHIQKSKKRPVILVPGFLSTKLISWKKKECIGMNLDVGERVWINMQKILSTRIVGPGTGL